MVGERKAAGEVLARTGLVPEAHLPVRSLADHAEEIGVSGFASGVRDAEPRRARGGAHVIEELAQITRVERLSFAVGSTARVAVRSRELTAPVPRARGTARAGATPIGRAPEVGRQRDASRLTERGVVAARRIRELRARDTAEGEQREDGDEREAGRGDHGVGITGCHVLSALISWTWRKRGSIPSITMRPWTDEKTRGSCL